MWEPNVISKRNQIVHTSQKSRVLSNVMIRKNPKNLTVFHLDNLHNFSVVVYNIKNSYRCKPGYILCEFILYINLIYSVFLLSC